MFTGFRFTTTNPLEIAAFGQAGTLSPISAGGVTAGPTLPQPETGGDFHILPFPMPGDGPHILPFPGPGDAAPGFTPPSVGLPERVAGTEGDDRIAVPTGAVAAGLGGNDVFVLTPGDAGKAGQPLAVITDFNEGDSLDLSQLGEGAKILGREAPNRPWGADRVSLDFNGDGSEDGFVLLAGKAPDLGGFRPYPMPTIRGDIAMTAFTPNGPFTGAVSGPIAGDGAAGIRLMGDFTTFEGMDLSVV